jgi:IPT/TIG domain
MLSRRFWFAVAPLCAAGFLLLDGVSAQQAPPASGARTLLLPRRVVSGERATLAVLDANGRLTPGVTVNFSNGDRLTTDTTGRALFVAPLNPGVVFASIEGRPGRVPTAVVSPVEGAASSIEISSAPRAASISDRIELTGRGFCGDADANQVTIGGKAALVLASSPSSLVVLPPSDLEPGTAAIEVVCARHSAPTFAITFVAMQLEADSSPLAPGEHRVLTVRVRGTTAKVGLEARNLAPDIAELAGGNPLRLSTSGGAENSVRFEITGRKRGSFLISIRLLSPVGPSRP